MLLLHIEYCLRSPIARSPSLGCFLERSASLSSCFHCSFASAGQSWRRTMTAPPANPQLPPHLRELCTILAAGLVRLRRRTAAEFARDAEQAAARGESSLHFTARQSVHADPLQRAP